jgi:hypothetical protein
MKVDLVNIEYVNQTWPLVSDFINAAIAQQNGDKDYTLDQIMTLVSLGKWLLFVAVRDEVVIGACTVSLFNRPSQRVAFVTYAGGEALSTVTAFDQLCKILKKFGATYIEGAANAAGARLWGQLGLTEKYRVLGAPL